MTRKTMFRTGLITAGALAATLLAGGAAQAAGAAGEPRNPGMQRMHELMQEQNPGMQRMHELMRAGNPGMQRMMQGGGMQMGPATQ